MRPAESIPAQSVHNAARHLREALDSMLAQDFSDFELLFVERTQILASWSISSQRAPMTVPSRTDRGTSLERLAVRIKNSKAMDDCSRSRATKAGTSFQGMATC